MRKFGIYILSLIVIFFFNGISSASELSEEALSKKKEGWYPAGIPLLAYNSDDGLGYGARALLFNNGQKHDKYFNKSPYFHKITVQYYQTTNGVQYHFAGIDMPYFLGTKFRILTEFAYEEKLNANYYGTGPEKSDSLTDRNGNSYSTFENYSSSFLLYPPENYKYNNYKIKRPDYQISAFYDITSQIKIMAGLDFKWTKIKTWDGKNFDLEDAGNNVPDGTYTSADTLITNDSKQYQDGWINFLKIGIGYDTRDHEIDPRSGIFLDYTLLLGNFLLGSDFNYAKNTLAARFFISPFNFLTFAARAVYSNSTKGTPFHELGYFYFLLDTQDALGNSETLRGYPANRFTGFTMTNANLEIRLQVAELTPFNQRFEIKLISFLDTGSVFDRAYDPFREFKYYHLGYGGGVAVAWNQSFIIHFVYGLSREASSISFNFGYAI